jgi:hypothetical protein
MWFHQSLKEIMPEMQKDLLDPSLESTVPHGIIKLTEANQEISSLFLRQDVKTTA